MFRSHRLYHLVSGCSQAFRDNSHTDIKFHGPIVITWHELTQKLYFSNWCNSSTSNPHNSCIYVQQLARAAKMAFLENCLPCLFKYLRVTANSCRLSECACRRVDSWWNVITDILCDKAVQHLLLIATHCSTTAWMEETVAGWCWGKDPSVWDDRDYATSCYCSWNQRGSWEVWTDLCWCCSIRFKFVIRPSEPDSIVLN